MAVTKITCPECKTVLRPAKPLPPGKTVKCPECGNRFTVSEEEPEAPPRKKAAPDGERRPKKSADPKAAPKKPAARKPATDAKPAAAKKDDDDEGGGTYRFEDSLHENEDKPEIEYAPDMSIKDLRGPAQSALVRPTNAMIAVGALGFFGYVASLILILIPTLFPIDSDEGDKNKPPKPVIGLEHGLGAVQDAKDLPVEMTSDPARKTAFELFGINFGSFGALAWYLFVLILLPIFIGMAYCAVVTYGAVRLQNLEGYGWGVASCIMMMIPLHSLGFMGATAILVQMALRMFSDDLKFVYGVLIGMMVLEKLACIGVGVWGLITLLSEKVVKGFEYKPE